jgi:hypothetical protein
MAKPKPGDMVHVGTSHRWRGVFVALCGVTFPLTTSKSPFWHPSVPACPTCEQVKRNRDNGKKATKRGAR